MKKALLLNSSVSAAISRMGHTDWITIADCGLPVRGSAERIDLALHKGVPGFLDVLSTVLSELCVERAILAEEIKETSPEMLRAVLSELGEGVSVEYVPHEEFKRLTQDSVAVVRTGECTSYANVILQSGVTF
uniref:D-ribose pyranase n=1 Tax=Olsenella timonensis TaxID=1805478 RepID=UPI00094E4959|nr:D-ribose pyranase [Olsenella timonensis]